MFGVMGPAVDEIFVTAGGGGGGGDTTPPTITIVSPTPPAGFPADYITAIGTEIVADLTDVTPGLRYACLVARLGGGPTPPANIPEEVVYRRGVFRGPYFANSTSEVIANGIRLHIRRDGGWPGTGTLGDVTLELDVLDGAGNLAS